MSEEELKEVREFVKKVEKEDVSIGELLDTTNWLYDLTKEVIKLQKENKILEEKINKVLLMIDENYRSEWYDDYETIAELRDDIYDLLKNKYKGVKR